MAYGDYDGPNKADKGKEGGSCNRERCQDSPANYYNHWSHSWYCKSCSLVIGRDAFNYKHWMKDYFPECQHPMFEARGAMTARGVPIHDK